MYKPRYTISDKLLNDIAMIESCRTNIDTSYILPEWEIEMRDRASVESTHSSTSIEGNPLGLKQVERVLTEKAQLTRHQYAEIEVKNYKKALDFIEKRKLNKIPISLQDMMAIHGLVTDRLLPKEKVGILRKSPIFVTNSDGSVVYTGPEATILEREISELIDWLIYSDTIHPVIVAGILHLWLVSIHPFADGNGRTARLITNLYLGLVNYDFRSSLVLESYYSVDKQAYYDALDLANNYIGRKKSDITPWLQYFVDGFLSSAKVLSIEVNTLSGLARTNDRRRISQSESDLLSYVKQFGAITLADAQDILIGVSRRTVQRKLMKLVDSGYLIIERNGPSTRYVWKNS